MIQPKTVEGLDYNNTEKENHIDKVQKKNKKKF